MEFSQPSLTLAKRVAFWKAALLKVGKSTGKNEDDLPALLDAIDAGMLGDDVIKASGAELLTHALAYWPKQADVYDDTLEFANLHVYTPGQSWEGQKPHYRQERLVASLLAAGADPWSIFLTKKDDGTLVVPAGQSFPPAFFALRRDPVPRSSFAAFLSHPSCPSLDELALHRDESGQSWLDMAVDKDASCLQLLLKKGMDPNTPGKASLAPIFHARTSDRVKILIAAGAKTDVMDKAGNSLPMHWAIHAPYASHLSSLLPSHAKGKDKGKSLSVSLNSLTNSLLRSNKSQVATILSHVGDIPSRQWEVNGQSLNLMDLAVSIAAFAPPSAVLPLLSELSLKRHAWPQEDKDSLSFLLDYIWSPDGRPSDEVDKFKKTLRFKPDELDAGRVGEVLDRMLAVRKAVFGTHKHKDIENQVQSYIHYGWLAAMEKIQARGNEWDDALLSSLRCMEKSVQEAGKIAPLFSDKTFSLIAPLVERRDLDEPDWCFWTGCGIVHGSLSDASNWDVWASKMPGHDPAWMDDAFVQRCLAIRSKNDPQLTAKLDQMILDHGTQAADIPYRPSRRI
jgi:hypothetical protein